MKGSKRILFSLSRRLVAGDMRPQTGRVLVHLNNHKSLYAADMRRFGTMTVTPEEVVPPTIDSSDPKGLSGATREAERLLTVKTHQTASNSQAAIDAADSLLAASSRLNRVLLSNTSSSQVATLHRAFVELTSSCLDHILPANDEPALVLHKALSLARRAHELDLPLHLPLCQRFMGIFAESAQANLILEAASWIAGTRDDPASIVCPYVLRLIESQHVACAYDLLVGLRAQYGMQELDLDIVVDILLRLRTWATQEIATVSGKEILPAAIEIVAYLEESVMPIIMDESSLSDRKLREQVKTLLGRINDSEMEKLLESMFPTIMDEKEKAAFMQGERLDPLILAVSSMLTKEVRNPRAKSMLAGLIQYCRDEPDKAIPTRPRVKLLGTFVDDENHRVYQALEFEDVADENNDEDVNAWSESCMTPGDVIYARTRDCDFPDITWQVVELNGGEKLCFTKEFEDILWTRDFKEDAEVFESMLPDIHFDDDSSDDDDDF